MHNYGSSADVVESNIVNFVPMSYRKRHLWTHRILKSLANGTINVNELHNK